MQPDVLAIAHSKIIDAKLVRLREAFVVMKNEMNEQTTPLLNNLLVDNKGVCINCKENMVIVGRALLAARKILKRNRSLINELYKDGTLQIDVLANDYIQWLKGN